MAMALLGLGDGSSLGVQRICSRYGFNHHRLAHNDRIGIFNSCLNILVRCLPNFSIILNPVSIIPINNPLGFRLAFASTPTFTFNPIEYFLSCNERRLPVAPVICLKALKEN